MPSDMERWRSFFAQAEADLWTIINQAILIAAADFPAEFMRKRGEIAEILFARRQCPSPPTRSKEATMLSGSVITNATSDGKRKVPYQSCTEDGDDIRHTRASRVELKVAGAESLGMASKPFAAERHILHSDKSVELDTRLRNCNDPRNFPESAHDVAMDHSIHQNVSMIKDQIMDLANQSEDGLLKFLHALEHLDINVEILKATDIGREVNKFRKHSSGPVRNLVKQLVRTWKSMVDDWVRYAAIVDPLNGEQDIVIGDLRHVNSQTEASAQRPLQPSKQFLNKSTGDSTSILRLHLQTEQAVEEMGSSRVESDELYRPGFMERKSNSCGQQVQNSRCIVIKSNTGGLGPGRPSTSTLDAEKVSANEIGACNHQHAKEESRSYVQEGGLQKNGHGKIIIAQNLSAAEHERLETTKRRLPLEDQHVERAKKQRDMPPLSNVELSKRGLLSAKLPACAKPLPSIQKR